jgi:hypothetical protein
LLANGTDPSKAKKHAKHLASLNAANTFEAIAREWYGQKKHGNRSPDF